MSVELTISQGKLRGAVEQTENGCKFLSFMGIPYAKPPLGPLKYKAPQPAEKWDGVLEANNDSHVCINNDFLENKITGSFDCLYLNVFTPNLPNEDIKLKPVMVWIHGGAFISGSKSRQFYGPEYLMEKDVVMVSINYRLGVIGFLSLKDPTLGVSGNAGMKDQVMALKWVQQNIAAFGGDPNNVTIFGESAGGASVSYQLLSPMAKGLFHKAIMQSGVAVSSWACGRTDIATELIKTLGKTASSEAEILAILENMDERELIEAQLKLPEVWKPNEFRYLAPTVETSTSEEHFLSDTPLNILKSGNYNKVPVITGCTSNEGLVILMVNPTRADLRPATDAEYAPYWLNLNPEQAAEIGNEIKQFYYGDKTPSNENIQNYYDYLSDVYFRLGAIDFAENLIKTSGNKVFLYNFAQITKLNQFSTLFKFPENCEGVPHGEDMLYIFKSLLSSTVAPNSDEYKGIQRMITWWTNFAKYSDPNGVDEDPLLEVKWPKASENMEFLNINNQPSVEEKLYDKVVRLWRSIQDKSKTY